MKQKKQQIAAVKMLQESYESKEIIFKLAKNDFKTKYAGSYLGILWAFVQPVITILLYWFVFQIGFRNNDVGDYPFVLWLTAGLVPWFLFSDAWNGATTSLLEYSYLVKKVVFNIGILPVIKVGSACFVSLAFNAFVILIFLVNGCGLSPYLLQLVYYFICIIMLTWGLGYFTSAVVVFIRDLTHLLNVVLQVLMWLTPIMWQFDMVKDYPWLVVVLKSNPVFYIVQGYRDSLFAEQWFWEKPLWTLYFWGFTFVVFMIGSHVFQKMRPHFADVM